MTDRKKEGLGLFNIVQTTAAVSTAMDVRRMREAEEQKLRVMQEQTSLMREQKGRDENERKRLARERRTLQAKELRRKQLAAVEKIHKAGLGIRHEHLELVENIALEHSVGLREAAAIFKKRLRELDLDIFLPENEGRLTAMHPDWKARDPQIEALTMHDELELGGEFDQPAIFEDFLGCYQSGEKFPVYLARRKQEIARKDEARKDAIRQLLSPCRQRIDDGIASEAHYGGEFGLVTARLIGWTPLTERPTLA